jgi:hypothetical protein
MVFSTAIIWIYINIFNILSKKYFLSSLKKFFSTLTQDINLKILFQNGTSCSTTSTLATEIAKARQHIKSSLERVDGVANLNTPGSELLERISALEKDNSQLHGVINKLQTLVVSLEGRLQNLEQGPPSKDGNEFFH